MARTPTAEQKQAAAEKRDRMRALSKQIAAMSEEQRVALVDHWPVTIEGHRLSGHNACMIAYQGGATVVGGFRQWLAAGRAVRKGEHGMSIWIPCHRKSDDGTPGETFFTLATVFDIAQTDPVGEPAECAA